MNVICFSEIIRKWLERIPSINISLAAVIFPNLKSPSSNFFLHIGFFTFGYSSLYWQSTEVNLERGATHRLSWARTKFWGFQKLEVKKSIFQYFLFCHFVIFTNKQKLVKELTQTIYQEYLINNSKWSRKKWNNKRGFHTVFFDLISIRQLLWREYFFYKIAAVLKL